MAGFDVVIDGEFFAVDGAIPDFMIALSGSIIATLLVAQNIFDLICIARHLRRFWQTNAFVTLLCLATQMKHDLDILMRIERVLV